MYINKLLSSWLPVNININAAMKFIPWTYDNVVSRLAISYKSCLKLLRKVCSLRTGYWKDVRGISSSIWCLTLDDVDCGNGGGVFIVVSAWDGIVIVLRCKMYKGMRKFMEPQYKIAVGLSGKERSLHRTVTFEKNVWGFIVLLWSECKLQWRINFVNISNDLLM